jgi:hypothetical protein
MPPSGMWDADDLGHGSSLIDSNSDGLVQGPCHDGQLSTSTASPLAEPLEGAITFAPAVHGITVSAHTDNHRTAYHPAQRGDRSAPRESPNPAHAIEETS